MLNLKNGWQSQHKFTTVTPKTNVTLEKQMSRLNKTNVEVEKRMSRLNKTNFKVEKRRPFVKTRDKLNFDKKNGP